MSIAASGKDICADGLSGMTTLDSVSNEACDNPCTYMRVLVGEDSVLNVAVEVLF